MSANVINSAVSGTTCTQQASSYTAHVGSKFNGAKSNAASILCGAADYLFGGTTANAYTQILSWVVSAKATGFNPVLVATMISHNGVGGDTFKSTLNALITGGAVANGYTVVDFGANATMGCDGCFANATYFQDGIHPTAAGDTILSGILKATLQTFGLQ